MEVGEAAAAVQVRDGGLWTPGPAADERQVDGLGACFRESFSQLSCFMLCFMKLGKDWKYFNRNTKTLDFPGSPAAKTSTAGGVDSIPGRGIKILHAKEKKKKKY